MKHLTTHLLNKIQHIYFYIATYKSKQFYKIFFFATFVFILSCSIPPSFADENVGDVIILFDQSASMKDYDPGLISKVWMLKFIKTFEKPYDVFLVGFDDSLHERAKVTMKNKKDVETIWDKIKRISTHGLTTDLEVPLRYLLERNGSRPIALAVIVSDGEPEIWDEKRWYLSKRVRTDPRYEKLNKQYRSLKAQGFTKKELYNRLKDIYHARNLELISQRLAKLKKKLGEKLVFLDISGNFGFFKNWAKAANARYVLANALGGEDPLESLRGTIIALQEKASGILSEQLPSDHEERIEHIPEPKFVEKPAVEKPETVTPSKPELPVKLPDVPDKEPTILKEEVKEPDKKELSKIWKIFLVVIILLVVAIFFPVLSRYRKKVKPAVKEFERVKDKISENKTLEQADSNLKKLSSSSIKDANKFIENEMQMAINDADKEQGKILDAEKDKFRFDTRSFLKIPLRTGAMIIHWVNENGERRHGNAIKISMDSVIFEASDFDDGRIDSIECPGMGTAFNVKQSRIISKEGGQAVAAVDEFGFNIDDRIKWVETLTRIEEET